MKVKVKKVKTQTPAPATADSATEVATKPEEKESEYERCSPWETFTRVIDVLALLFFFFLLCAGLLSIPLYLIEAMFDVEIISWICAFATAHPVISIVIVLVAFISFGLYMLVSVARRIIRRFDGSDEQ